MAEAPMARRSTAVDGGGTAGLPGFAEAMTHSSRSRRGSHRQLFVDPPSRRIVDNPAPYTGGGGHARSHYTAPARGPAPLSVRRTGADSTVWTPGSPAKGPVRYACNAAGSGVRAWATMTSRPSW